jgi:hypothetical protein
VELTTDETRGVDELAPEQYKRLVDDFTREAADDFRRAGQDFVEQHRACVRYFRRGHSVGLSHPELIDFLGVSTPSVLDKAGYSDEDSQRVMGMLADISDEIDED